MVRKVPMGTRGKMRLEFEIVNPELLDSYVEFVRTKYERDILAAIIKKQKENKDEDAYYDDLEDLLKKYKIPLTRD